MKLSLFLTEVLRQDWQFAPLTYFHGTQFSALFFSRLFAKLKQHSSVLVIESLKASEKSARAAALQQSFLGQKKLYWLGDVLGIDAFKFQSLESVLSYQGPHTLLFFLLSENVPVNPISTHQVIVLESVVDASLFFDLASFFSIPLNMAQRRFVTLFFERVRQLSLDSAIVLLDYLQLMPEIKGKLFGRTMLSLFEEEGTLFDLSSYFFAKDGTAFFTQLKSLGNEYAEPFWIAYWSEQLWRAYHTVYYLQQKNMAQAKRAAFRLPFSFLTKQWKKVSLQELKKAYQFLYGADFGFKTGKTFCSLDFFYAQFFNGSFAKELK